MTSPRACRRCGAPVPADVRWCTRCYEPAREFSPRTPVHDRDFVGSPIHERGDIPRWSRWEATATTFGPRGRIGLTALLFATLIPSLTYGGFVYVITFPVLATVLLKEIWAKGWYVPASESPAVEQSPATERSSPAQPHEVTITSTKLIRSTLLVAGTAAFVYGDAGVKAGVVGFAAVALLVWFWRDFGG
jgi:hypothetical protein